MNFMELKMNAKNNILVNMDRVAYIHDSKPNITICFDDNDNYIVIEETFEKVKNLLNSK